MSIPFRLFSGLLKAVNNANKPDLLNKHKEFYVNAINKFYENGFLIDKIDENIVYNLSNLSNFSQENIEKEMYDINHFFKKNNFIHIGNLQTLFTLMLGYEYKSVKEKINSSLQTKLSNVNSRILNTFTPEIIANSNDYSEIIKSLYKYMNDLFFYTKSSVYNENKQIYDSYNASLYLEKFVKLNLNESEYNDFFNSFYTVFNYGFISFEAQLILRHQSILIYKDEVNSFNIDILDLLNLKETEKFVIQAFKFNPNKIKEIETIHNKIKEIGNDFTSKDQLIELIENYVKLLFYSQKEVNNENIDLIIEKYLITIRPEIIRLLCFYTFNNIMYVEPEKSFNQLKICCSQISNINPNLISNF